MKFSETTISTSSRSVPKQVHIVMNLVTPLLGKPAIFKPGLSSSIDKIQTDTNWRPEFPKLFFGLGTIKLEAKIILDDGKIPYAQSAPCMVAVAKRQPPLEELQIMESLGSYRKSMIRRMGVLPALLYQEKERKLHLRMGFTKLNKVMKKKFHPIPNTQETFNEHESSKIFSKLDANRGYWQLKLRPKAQKSTSFITACRKEGCRKF